MSECLQTAVAIMIFVRVASTVGSLALYFQKHFKTEHEECNQLKNQYPSYQNRELRWR